VRLVVALGAQLASSLLVGILSMVELVVGMPLVALQQKSWAQLLLASKLDSLSFVASVASLALVMTELAGTVFPEARLE
jgi:hypothetical protein